MGRKERLAFGLWDDRGPDNADPNDFPRCVWGRTELYVDGDTVVLAKDDPRLRG